MLYMARAHSLFYATYAVYYIVYIYIYMYMYMYILFKVAFKNYTKTHFLFPLATIKLIRIMRTFLNKREDCNAV